MFSLQIMLFDLLMKINPIRETLREKSFNISRINGNLLFSG